MRRRKTVLWALLLCACGLVLAACGGAPTSASDNAAETAADDAEAAEAEKEKADPSEAFLGTWLMASMSDEGVTVMYDYAEIPELEDELTLQVNEDETAEVSFFGRTGTYSWEMQDDTTMLLTKDEQDAEDGEDETPLNGLSGLEDDAAKLIEEGQHVTLSLADDCLVMSGDDEGGYTTLITWSRDGTDPDKPTLDASRGVPFTSTNGLAGTYQMSGVNYMGIIMYGSGDAMYALAGGQQNSTLVVNEDGTAVLFGEAVFRLKVADEGTFLSNDVAEVPLKRWNGGLVIDMSELTESTVVAFFSK